MRTNIITPAKLLTGMLLSAALAIPMVAEAGRGHHRHHHHHHHDRHDHHEHHHYYGSGPGYGGYGYDRPRHHKHKHRHIQHNHYNTRNIYYNQPYYPPVYDGGYYGAAPGNFFLGINTGNARFMLGY